jgi:ATP-GRASP peptide maturase of grasp-with-spasm system
MICILSQSFLEPTTEAVMDWLDAWKVPHIRINGDDIDRGDGPLFSIRQSGVEATLTVDGKTVEPRAIKVVWYRRWVYNSQYKRLEVVGDRPQQKQSNTLSLFQHLRNELQIVSEFFFSRLADAAWLGHPSNSSVNKLKVLTLAASFGLDIPDTLVTTDLDDLREFVRKHGEVITKPASEVFLCRLDGRMKTTYTAGVPERFLNGQPWGGGFPALFQERLRKRYEVRTFYLDGRCYSMAIFSQRLVDTQTDFRRYTYEDPTRTVPYRLPAATEAALRRLMQALNLDTGSIDLVRTVDGRLVFLEVNPVGQFGMVSVPCNYFLEREVARALANRLDDARRRED